jgi:hypothetical protein
MTRSCQRHIAIAGLGLLLCLICAPIAAREPDDVAEREHAIKAARHALASRGNVPWYDADKDALRPVRLTGPLPFDLGWLFQPLFWLIVAFAGVVLALVVWWMVWAFVARQRRAPPPAPLPRPFVATEGLEALPFLEDRPRDDLLGRARRHYESGNFAEAIVYLFSYELVELDRSSLVRLARGKTNRQYLRETSHLLPLAGLLERTMNAFEGVFFGGQPLDRLAFEACWRELDEFDNLVSTTRGVS